MKASLGLVEVVVGIEHRVLVGARHAGERYWRNYTFVSTRRSRGSASDCGVGDAADLAALLDVPPDGRRPVRERVRDNPARPVVEGPAARAGRRRRRPAWPRPARVVSGWMAFTRPASTGRRSSCRTTVLADRAVVHRRVSVQMSRRTVGLCASGSMLLGVVAARGRPRHGVAAARRCLGPDGCLALRHGRGRRPRPPGRRRRATPATPRRRSAAGARRLGAVRRVLPTIRRLHAGLLAQFTGHMARSPPPSRPHAGIGQAEAHRTAVDGRSTPSRSPSTARCGPTGGCCTTTSSTSAVRTA